jgi:hypothetical protein
MWSLLPVAQALRHRVARKPPRSLYEVADREWQIAPSEPFVTPPAYYLPNQLERITGWTFASAPPRRIAEGGIDLVHGQTRAFLLKDAYLIDGVLYKGNACAHLHPRASRFLQLAVEREVERGAVYCTFPGNRYFGQWLMDDCVAYPLATAEGIPVSTDQPIPVHTPGSEGHTTGYEQRLGMKPARLHSAFFRELVIFDDVGQNSSKRERFRALGQKLLASQNQSVNRAAARSAGAKSHPGVFIIRGKTGERRILKNELELAEQLRASRGFRVVDIRTADVATLIDACAGARIVVGVEGSQLIHGIVLLPPGGAVLTLQPPKRFCPILKDLTDRDGQHFGFIVGTPDGDDLYVDRDEVERTLDLFPATT